MRKLFFLLAFLLPQLIFAAFEHEDCNKLIGKIDKEWAKHQEFLDQFIKISAHEQEANLYLLEEALICCRKALNHCHKILHKISKKSKAERKDPWWAHQKKLMETQIPPIEAEIKTIENAMLVTRTNAVLQKIQSLIDNAERNAASANSKALKCPEPTEQNLPFVLSLLNEVIQDYETALSHTRMALSIFEASTELNEANKQIIYQIMESYQANIANYRQVIESLGTKMLDP